MNRLRSPAGPAKSLSMAGVSHSMRMYSPRAPELFCSVPVNEHQAPRCAAIRFAGSHAPAGAEFHVMRRACNLCRNGPGNVGMERGQLVKIGAPEAPPRRQQRNGFEQVGFARPVGTRKGNEARASRPAEAGIVAEIVRVRRVIARPDECVTACRVTPASASAHRGPVRRPGRA